MIISIDFFDSYESVVLHDSSAWRLLSHHRKGAKSENRKVASSYVRFVFPSSWVLPSPDKILHRAFLHVYTAGLARYLRSSSVRSPNHKTRLPPFSCKSLFNKVINSHQKQKCTPARNGNMEVPLPPSNRRWEVHFYGFAA